MPKHQWITYADSGNAWDEGDNDIDIFAYEFGEYHNGPRCKVCGIGGCHHCDRGIYDEECPGEEDA